MLLLIESVLADKNHYNAPKQKEFYALDEKDDKNYDKDFSKNIIKKISKNRKILSHILLRQSLTGNFTKSHFFAKILSREGINWLNDFILSNFK